MPNESYKELDSQFGITKAEQSVEAEVVVKEMQPTDLSTIKPDDTTKDYRYVRAQLYDIVEKMQESLNDAMDVAHESQHPRAFEVVFNGAKNAADVVDKITDLHKKMKDLEAEEVKVQQTNTQNNIYMSGSTNDLIKMLKENKDK